MINQGHRGDAPRGSSVNSIGGYKLPQENQYTYKPLLTKATEGSINVSGFGYQDLNHNGIYDIKEQSMMEARFMLIHHGSSDQKHVQSTNRAGFANFSMSAHRESAPINKTGSYTLIAFPPPGMKITSKNQLQSFNVTRMQGSIGDLALDKMPKPVGFAALPNIQGHLPKGSIITIKPAINASGTQKYLPKPNDNGQFQQSLPGIGDWIITTSNSEYSYTRNVRAAPGPIIISSVKDLARQTSLANAISYKQDTKASFDDLTITTEVRKIPSGYAGLHWDNITAIHNKFEAGAGYHNIIISGNFAAYTSSGQPGAIKRSRPFDFIGGHFAIAHSQRSGECAIIHGYKNNDLIYKDRFALSSFFPTYFRADYLGITKLVIRSERNWQVVMEDLEFKL
jgi:hypothetical protein